MRITLTKSIFSGPATNVKSYSIFAKVLGTAHARYPKKRVPEEGEIGRTFTIFDFFTYFLGARHPNYLPDKESGL